MSVSIPRKLFHVSFFTHVLACVRHLHACAYLRSDSDGGGGDVPKHLALISHDHLVANDVPCDLAEEGVP